MYSIDMEADCKTCHQVIRPKQQVLTCKLCLVKHHRTCIKEVSQAEYRQMIRANTLCDWTCRTCCNGGQNNTPYALQEMGFSTVRSQTGCITVSTEQALACLLEEGGNTNEVPGTLPSTQSGVVYPYSDSSDDSDTDFVSAKQWTRSCNSRTVATTASHTLDSRTVATTASHTLDSRTVATTASHTLDSRTVATTASHSSDSRTIATTASHSSDYRTVATTASHSSDSRTVATTASHSSDSRTVATTASQISTTDVPGQPRFLVHDHVTSSSVNLDWLAPTDGSTVCDYIIEKCQVPGSQWLRVNKTPVHCTRYTVTDLQEGGVYLFRVTSRNAAGPGQPSRSTCQIQVKNPYDKPGAPGRPTITMVTTDSVTAEWTAADDNGDAVSTYFIEYRQSGSTRWSSVDTNSSGVSGHVTNRFTVSGLVSGSSYEFRVLAENRAGRGEPSLVSNEVITKDLTEYFCCDLHGGSAWQQRTDSCDPFCRIANIVDVPMPESSPDEVKFRLDETQVKLLADSWDRGRKCYSRKIQARIYRKGHPEVPSDFPTIFLRVNDRHVFSEQSKWRFDITSCCCIASWKNHGIVIRSYNYVQWNAIRRECNISVDIVEKTSLLDQLKVRVVHPQHTRDMVKQQLTSDCENEVATTSLRISLVCPIGKMRIVYPCRAWGCSHLQCVDGNTVICLGEKRLKWNCHLCNKPATFDKLRIDGLIAEILAEVPEHVTEVEFDGDGRWHYQGEKENTDPDVLELSNCLDMIDLTETDDEISPVKKPLAVNINLLNKSTSHEAHQKSNTSNADSRPSILGSGPLSFHSARFNTQSSSSWQSNSRGTVLGTNYGQRESQSCHRHQSSASDRSSRRPYDQHNGYQSHRNDRHNGYQSPRNDRHNGYQSYRNDRHNGYQSYRNDRHNGHQSHRNDSYIHQFGRYFGGSSGHSNNSSGYNSSNLGFFDRLGRWIGTHRSTFRRPMHS